MNDALERINQAGKDEAESIFRDCCGSAEWMRADDYLAPFASEGELMETADAIWNDHADLGLARSIFAHPKIGETKQEPQARSAAWSAGEQAGMSHANQSVRQELAAAKPCLLREVWIHLHRLRDRKSAEEMLELCRVRFGNDRETEIAIAAEEQQIDNRDPITKTYIAMNGITNPCSRCLDRQAGSRHTGATPSPDERRRMGTDRKSKNGRRRSSHAI
jgi:hypothetical protein